MTPKGEMMAEPGAGKTNLLYLVESPIHKYKAKGINYYMRYAPDNYFGEVHVLSYDLRDEGQKIRDYKVHAMPLWASGTLLPLDALRLRKFIKKHKIGVVFTQDVYLHGLRALWAARLSGIPIIGQIAGLNREVQDQLKQYPAKFRFLSRWAEQYVLRRCNVMVCYDELHRKYLEDLGVKPSNIFFAQNWTDTEMFSPQTDGSQVRAGLGAEGKKILLFVGRFSGDKMVDYVIESMPRVASQQDCLFVFIGQGPLEKEMKRRIKELGMEKNAVFPGPQPDKKVAEFLAASDAVLIPLGGAILREAMAAGKPIVAFKIEWHPRIIKSGENGVMTEHYPDDKERTVKEYSEAINQVLADGELRKKMGARARDTILKGHSWSAFSDSLTKLYDKLLAE